MATEVGRAGVETCQGEAPPAREPPVEAPLDDDRGKSMAALRGRTIAFDALLRRRGPAPPQRLVAVPPHGGPKTPVP